MPKHVIIHGLGLLFALAFAFNEWTTFSSPHASPSVLNCLAWGIVVVSAHGLWFMVVQLGGDNRSVAKSLARFALFTFWLGLVLKAVTYYWELRSDNLRGAAAAFVMVAGVLGWEYARANKIK